MQYRSTRECGGAFVKTLDLNGCIVSRQTDLLKRYRLKYTNSSRRYDHVPGVTKSSSQPPGLWAAMSQT